jgi:hypothetical protein
MAGCKESVNVTLCSALTYLSCHMFVSKYEPDAVVGVKYLAFIVWEGDSMQVSHCSVVTMGLFF